MCSLPFSPSIQFSSHWNLPCISTTSLKLTKFCVQVSVLISLNALAAFSRAHHFLLLETFFYLSFHSVTLFWLSSCLISNSVYIYLLFLLTQPLNVGDLQGLIQPSFFFILSPKGDLLQLHDFK